LGTLLLVVLFLEPEEIENVDQTSFVMALCHARDTDSQNSKDSLARLVLIPGTTSYRVRTEEPEIRL
jgi:hypothetical protein